MTILSTKKLSSAQKNLLLNSNIGLVEYNAIQIFSKEISVSKPIENAIVTSKNSAKWIVKNKIAIQKCFCVGEKTAAYLEQNQFIIAEKANYGKILAEKIIKNHSEKEFVFFCGNKRRRELPEALKKNNISFEEVEVYETQLNPKKFQQEFDGVLFFSPSAVQSFIQLNSLKNTTAFCIGTTTAEEAKKHTNHIIIANQPTIENVIVQVVKNFLQGF